MNKEMENLIGNANTIIELNQKLRRLEINLKNVVDVDLEGSFEIHFYFKSNGAKYEYYIGDKKEREFIIQFIQECLQKRIDEQKAELNQYVISKKI